MGDEFLDGQGHLAGIEIRPGCQLVRMGGLTPQGVLDR
jgi:hypothetical protein